MMASASFGPLEDGEYLWSTSDGQRESTCREALGGKELCSFEMTKGFAELLLQKETSKSAWMSLSTKQQQGLHQFWAAKLSILDCSRLTFQLHLQAHGDITFGSQGDCGSSPCIHLLSILLQVACVSGFTMEVLVHCAQRGNFSS